MIICGACRPCSPLLSKENQFHPFSMVYVYYVCVHLQIEVTPESRDLVIFYGHRQTDCRRTKPITLPLAYVRRVTNTPSALYCTVHPNQLSTSVKECTEEQLHSMLRCTFGCFSYITPHRAKFM